MTGIEIAYIALAVVSAGIGGYSAYEQGKQAEDAANYQAQTAKNNSISARIQADYEADRTRAKYRQLRGAQTAAYTKNGVSIDGSVSDIFKDTNMQEDLDVMSTLYKGKQNILGEQAKAQLYAAQGKNAYNQGILNAAGSVASSAGSTVGNYPTIG